MLAQVLALILVPVARADEPPLLPRVTDPVYDWVDGLRAQETIRLCFESGPAVPDTPPVEIRFSDPSDVASSVTDINASPYHAHFRVLALGDRTVVVPTEALDEQGNWKPYPSVLDTVVDLESSGPADTDVLLDRWMAALSKAIGKPVFLGSMLNPHGNCSVSGRGVARELLAAILDCRGSDDVWRLGLTRDGRYALHIYHLFLVNEEPIFRPEMTYEEWNRPPREVMKDQR